MEKDGTAKGSQLFKTEVHRGSQDFWTANKNSIVEVLTQSTADFLSKNYITELETKKLKRDLINPDTDIVFLKNKSDELSGFTYTMPCQYSLWQWQMDAIKKHTTQERTIFSGWTVITPENRQKGGWSMMMDESDQIISELDQYDLMSRTVRTANNYADKIRRRYLDKIVFEKEVLSPFGRQKQFLIKI